MELEAELAAARDIEVVAIADAIERIGFECTRCGHCCRGFDEDHTATVFPDEVRTISEATEKEWQNIARPMPFGIDDSGEGPSGETFEWALQTDDCGDCTFYGDGACSIYDERPLICQTYPFSLALGEDDVGTSESMGSVVERDGPLRAHECEGLGRDISRADAEALAHRLTERAIRELREAIEVRDNYQPTDVDGVVVHDSEGQKRPDGTPIEQPSRDSN